MDVQAIIRLFIKKEGGVNRGAKKIEKLLKNEWQWKHIANVSRGAKPSDRLIRKLKKLRPPPPNRKRYRTIIEATSKDQWEGWQNRTMEEKRNALDDM